MLESEMMNAPAQPISCPYPSWNPPVPTHLITAPLQPCPYLPGRTSRLRAFWADEMTPALYEAYMNAGFRRSGKMIYQPACPGCRACLPLRVIVSRFRPNKTQRRTLHRNHDVRLTIGDPTPSSEKFDLFARYESQWHQSREPTSWENFVAFLYDSPVHTCEMVYRDPDGKLLGVGICDIGPTTLSSVYFYFSPDESARSLGTHSALREIETAGQRGLEHYYLGYWVSGCGSMQYKANYRPHEVFHPDGQWREAEATPS